MSPHIVFHLNKTLVPIPNAYINVIKVFEVLYCTTWDDTKQGCDYSESKEDIG